MIDIDELGELINRMVELSLVGRERLSMDEMATLSAGVALRYARLLEYKSNAQTAHKFLLAIAESLKEVSNVLVLGKAGTTPEEVN